MMHSHDFEAELQSRPQRQLPPEWRAEILGATTAAPTEATRQMPQNCERRIAPSMWRWGSLAAVWALIGLLNLSSPEAEVWSVQTVAPAVDWEKHWQENQRMVAELLRQQPVEPDEPRRREIPPPRPRSGARPGARMAFRFT